MDSREERDNRIEYMPLRQHTLIFQVIIECRDSKHKTIQKSYLNFIELPHNENLNNF
jgi:hypothetical protein